MTIDWNGFNSALVAIGTVVGIAGTLYGIHRQRARPGQPELALKLAPLPHKENWYKASLTVTNRADVPIVCRRLKAISPRMTKLAKSDREAGDSADRLGATLDIELRLRKSGSEPIRPFGLSMIAWGETGHVDFLAFVPARISSWLSRSQRMLLIQASLSYEDRAASQVSIVARQNIPASKTASTADKAGPHSM